MHVHDIRLNPNLQLNQRLSPQQLADEKRAAEARRKLRLASEADDAITDEYVPGRHAGAGHEDDGQDEPEQRSAEQGPGEQGTEEQGTLERECSPPEAEAPSRQERPEVDSDAESESGSFSSWA